MKRKYYYITSYTASKLCIFPETLNINSQYLYIKKSVTFVKTNISHILNFLVAIKTYNKYKYTHVSLLIYNIVK